MNNLSESFKNLGDSSKRAADAFSAMTRTINALKGAIHMLFSQMARYPHKRSLRLAAYGSPRVRKKNTKRVARWIKKNLNTTKK